VRGAGFASFVIHIEQHRFMKTVSRNATVLPLLKASEVAERLRTSTKAVYAMIERGQLPGVVRIGRRVLIREDALIDFICQRSAPASTERHR
jgi:excisionase family DNA binding protein